jgi:mRNA interferase RelE/StbE
VHEGAVKVRFRTSFARDLEAIHDRAVVRRVHQAIEAVEKAGSLKEVSGVTKLAGTSEFYRVRIGEYRIGLAIEGGEVEFVRCLHRREIYRHFP